MPPMNWRARGLRVDDAADGEHAEHAVEADLAAVGVDADLDELRAERVARELGLRLDLVAGVDGDLALALRQQRLAGAHDGGAPRGGAHRAAGDARPGRSRSRRSRAARARGRRRGRRRRSGSARCGRRCRCRWRRSRPCSRRRARSARSPWRASGRRGRSRRRRRCRSASGRRRGRLVALRPAEALGALAQAGDEVARGERDALLGVEVGLVADPQLDRVDAAARSRARPSRTRARTCPGTRRARASTTAVGTSSATRRWRRAGGRAPRTSCASASQVCSANSRTVEVCSKASWAIAVRRPSLVAPRRTRWIVGVR